MTDEIQEGVPAPEPEAADAAIVENAAVADAAAEGVADAAAEGEPTSPEEPQDTERDRQLKGLQRAQFEERERRRQAEAQLEALKQQLAQPQAPQAPMAEMPMPADYDYDDEKYRQAMQAWNEQQWSAREQQREQQIAMYEQQQAALEEAQRLQEAYARGQEMYPDFIAKVRDPSLPNLAQVNPAAYNMIMQNKDRDTAIRMAYYLANNPTEVYELRELGTEQAIRRMVEIENRIKRSEAQKNRASNLNPPPSTVGGASEAVTDRQKMSTEDWMKWREGTLSR
jgi:hypothetical protein